MDSTEVLPESINSPSMRMGFVSGIGMKFMSSGDLMTLNDVNSLEFDSRALATIEPRVNELVSVLNQFGSQRLGDQLSLGTLHVDTKPEVRYLAPLYARGLTARWTVAMGIPVVTYSNKMSLSQSGSNLAAIRAQIGNASPEINQAFNQLNVNLATAAQELLAKKGYKPLTDRNETMMGDLSLASLIQLGKADRLSGVFKTIITLPTGPGNDPDDLADLGAFGYTAVENQLIGNYILGANVRAALKGGYRYNLPDSVVRRVPVNEADSLPGPETKETVNREVGGAWFSGGSISYIFSEALNFGIGYEMTRKQEDHYHGPLGHRYDLLSKESNSSSDRVRFAVSYSSIDSFMAGKAWLPTMIAYEFSDTIAGYNTERMTVHELWLQLFF